MKIAITGTSGRIGRAIQFSLCQNNRITGIDRAVSSVTTHLGDIDDYGLLSKAFKGADAVVHTAALHAPHVGVHEENEFYRINVKGTETVVRAAIACGASSLVFTSTTALYGYASQHPDEATWIDENTKPEPKSIYHRTKLEAEQFLEAEAGRNLKVTTLRMSRCFPEPAPIMAMYRLHRGIDARDVAEAHRLALIESDEEYRMFVVSGGTPFQKLDCRSLKQSPASVLTERCPAICETFESRGWSLPDSIDRIYDSSKAQMALQWKPVYGFEEVVNMLDNQISEVLPEQAERNRVSE
ncbi:MAG: NAD-dependent epimerase/dehydratase family protein [Pseudohongiellaceae bacterium]